MKRTMDKSRLMRVATIVLAVVLTLSVVAAASTTLLSSSSENAFNDVNPELLFAPIQGNAETNKSEAYYQHTSSLEQGDGSYAITTNSYVEWFDQDDIAFAYKHYGVKTNKRDYIELTCEVNYFTAPDGSEFDRADTHNPSTGVEFRSGLENNSSFYYLHLRNEGVITLVYRDSNYATSLFSCSAQENIYRLQPEDYPVKMKITMSGTTFQAFFQVNGSDEWQGTTPVKLVDFTSGVYAGVAAHSGSEAKPLEATFQNLTITGEQSMNISGGGEGGTPTEPEEVDPDPVYTDANLLLQETFTDGSLNNGTDQVTNPIWDSFTTKNGISIKNIQGNRMLYCEYANGMDFIGSEKWTDYSASMDFMYDVEQVDEADANVIGLVVRSVPNIYYGYQNYVICISGGTELCIYKSFMQYVTLLDSSKLMKSVALPESILKDDKIHNIKVACLDNQLTVYLDGVEMLTYVDDGNVDWGYGGGMDEVNSKGSVGLMFDGTFAYVDNIVVTKMEDPVGGDYDNAIGGNWDVPVPWYINKIENT